MSASSRPQSAEQDVQLGVWDLPVRLTHWLMVVLVISSWVSAENQWFDWHRLCGYSILTLLLFRLYWGLCGSTTARFASFLRGPGAVGRFTRGFLTRPASVVVGHNPLGGWNVLAMLLLLLTQCALGLFAVDVDGIDSGPLTHYVSFASGRRFAELHETVFYVLGAVIALHVAAVFTHLVFKRENLIRPMITGVTSVPCGQVPAIRFASLRRALLGLAASALLILWLVKGL